MVVHIACVREPLCDCVYLWIDYDQLVYVFEHSVCDCIHRLSDCEQRLRHYEHMLDIHVLC